MIVKEKGIAASAADGNGMKKAGMWGQLSADMR